MITLLAVPLPVLTVSFWRGSEVLFGAPQEVLSLEAASALDQRDQVRCRLIPGCAPVGPGSAMANWWQDDAHCPMGL